MRILVCVKQVPGSTQVELDPVTGNLKRDGAPAKLNPYDLFAVEQALRLRAITGGQVVVLSMGPGQARAALVETLSMGADRAALVSDRRFAGADVLSTAHTLAQAVQKLGDFDILLCGKQTTDGDTAQVGAELAELLGLPHAGNVLSIDAVEGGGVAVTVGLESTLIRQRLPLPCLLCMEAEVNTPRLPSYKRRKTLDDGLIETLTLDDMADRDERHYGLSGSATQVERVFPPEKGAERRLLQGDGPALAAQLAELLIEKKFV